MKYLLDTNICVHFFRGKYGILEKLNAIGIENCAISEITLAELVYGAEKSNNPSKNLILIESLVSQLIILPIFSAIPIYGKEKVRLKQKGELISDFDLLIGTTAIANQMILVTENVREFQRLDPLNLENWVMR
ncbi:MAG: type II toxin-antitoxin system VapC family toxin [Bacteroidia bacterium]|nr:type II toxin-antitoxin system VapC family toxin [Bacteroidia bacterium]